MTRRTGQFSHSSAGNYGSSQRAAPPRQSAKPYDWLSKKITGEGEVLSTRLQYALVTMPSRRRALAVSISYPDGRPVRAIPYQMSGAEREVVARILAMPRRPEDSLFTPESYADRQTVELLLRTFPVIGPNGQPLTLGEPLAAPFEGWEADTAGLQTFRLTDNDAAIVDVGGPWLLDGSTLTPVETTTDPDIAVKLVLEGPLRPEASAHIARQLEKLAPELAPRAIRAEHAKVKPTPAMTMDREGETPIARVGASYAGARVHNLGETGEVRSFDPKSGILRIFERDELAERDILDAAAQEGLQPTNNTGVYQFSNDGSEEDAAIFEERKRPRLEGAGWSVDSSDAWNIKIQRITRLQLEVALGHGGEGDYLLDVMGDGQIVDFIDPLTNIARSIPMDADEDEAPEFLARYVRGKDAVIRAEDGRVWIVPANEFILLVTSLRRILLAPRGPGEPLRADLYSITDLQKISKDVGLSLPQALERLFSAMRAENRPEVSWPACFTGEHEADQMEALVWLRTLFNAGYGGILADDVGFGKTIEIALHLASLREDGLLTRGAVVAVPNNSVEDWQRKIATHFPSLEIQVYHGRKRATPAEDAIVITSHDLIKRDGCPLNQRDWTIAVLDEAQDAKNPVSQLAYVMASLRAEQTIPTTATPIENSLVDLWTLMNIANQGLLGELPAFRKSVIDPIEIEADVATANRLNAITAPFMLQRIDINRPVPEFEEIVTDLTPEMRFTYDNTIGLLRKRFENRLEQAEETGKGVNQLGMSVLLSVTRVRQLCCSPMLMPGAISRPVEPSACSPKTRAMVDTAERLVAQRQRILVFSSWTGHLDILAMAMRNRGLRVAQYDGRMTKADKRVAQNRFAAHEVDLILMTTKSGGRSLDFNEADAVFMADPWWNPKVEKQCVGRATRRGQTKTIKVYRFIANAPVERKISEIQRRKDGLSELLKPGQIIDSCEGLTLSDIQGLLDTFEEFEIELRKAA